MSRGGLRPPSSADGRGAPSLTARVSCDLRAPRTGVIPSEGSRTGVPGSRLVVGLTNDSTNDQTNDQTNDSTNDSAPGRASRPHERKRRRRADEHRRERGCANDARAAGKGERGRLMSRSAVFGAQANEGGTKSPLKTTSPSGRPRRGLALARRSRGLRPGTTEPCGRGWRAGSPDRPCRAGRR